MANNFIVPPLGAKGRFKFVEPFNKEQYQNEELRVSAIRTFKELKDSSIDVYELIYQPVGLTENDLLKDIENNIPIVVLESQAGKYLNIPANKIQSLPDISDNFSGSSNLTIPLKLPNFKFSYISLFCSLFR